MPTQEQKRKALIAAMLKIDPKKGLEYLLEEGKPKESNDSLYGLVKEFRNLLDQATVDKGHVLEVLDELRLEVERVRTITKGDKGDTGDDGEDAIVDEERLISTVLQKIPKPKDGRPGEPGRDGSTPSIEAIVAAVLPKLPKVKDGDPGRDAVIQEEKIIEGLIKFLRTNKSLTIQDIAGAQGWMRDGVRYRFEELMHGAGSGGGSTGFQAPTSGAVDGSNTVFVWKTAPKVIVVDQGRAMQATSSDGTINWTGTTTTTLSVAPTFDVYASA